MGFSVVVNACTLCPGTDLMRRHAGVLGLSAYILSSPYDVPTWMPQLLMDLSAHLNDTQPIEVRPAPTHTYTHTHTHTHGGHKQRPRGSVWGQHVSRWSYGTCAVEYLGNERQMFLSNSLTDDGWSVCL